MVRVYIRKSICLFVRALLCVGASLRAPIGHSHVSKITRKNLERVTYFLPSLFMMREYICVSVRSSTSSIGILNQIKINCWSYILIEQANRRIGSVVQCNSYFKQ